MTEPSTSSRRAPSLVWFRDDLRLADNPALQAAVDRQAPLLCIFILETGNGLRELGAASRWWLHHSLAALSKAIEARGGHLHLLQGDAGALVPTVVQALKAGAVFWNRRYGAAGAQLDAAIAATIASDACHVESFNGRLIHEPWEIRTKAGGSYGVYTAYWKAAVALGDTSQPFPAPAKLDTAAYPPQAPRRASLESLDLLPKRPNWAKDWNSAWQPGEAGAQDRLEDFLDGDLSSYERDRNLLAITGTSHLSAHLRFGEVSPRQVVAAATEAAKERPREKDGTRKFIAELGWREFNYHVMHHHPDVADKNLHAKFDAMPWRRLPKAELDAWKRGRTGYPVVDAGMRELWATGYMHNRVRMIAASFLIKHLLGDWRIGEAWFWDCLCDADPANNPMNWQWVAGSGADAAPFFRVFNPVLQGQKFDPDGDYVRAHVPELGNLPGKVIHAPWTASETVLAEAGVTLGETYPLPIVDHKAARARALKAFETIKR